MTANPKTTAGSNKPSLLSVIPTTSLLVLGAVMRLGAKKYGAFNFRDSDVPASIYVDAAMRHLMSWWDGEDNDPESGVSHLGHVMACAAIVIEAKALGRLIDDRPTPGVSGAMISHWQAQGEFPEDGIQNPLPPDAKHRQSLQGQ